MTDIRLYDSDGKEFQRFGPGLDERDDTLRLFAFRKDGDFRKLRDPDTILIGFGEKVDKGEGPLLMISYDQEIVEDLVVSKDGNKSKLPASLIKDDYFVSGSGNMGKRFKTNFGYPISTLRSKKMDFYFDAVETAVLSGNHILAAYVVPSDNIPTILQIHQEQAANFSSPILLEWQKYLDNTLVPQGLLKPINQEGNAYPSRYTASGQGISATSSIFSSTQQTPKNVSADVALIGSGAEPKCNYAAGGVLQHLPKDIGPLPAFGFCPLEGHALVAVIGNQATPLSVVMAGEESGIEVFGAPLKQAFLAPKAQFVKSFGNALQIIRLLNEDCRKMCDTPCATGKNCPD